MKLNALRLATIAFTLIGLLGSYFVVQTLQGAEQIFWLLYVGLVTPLLFGAALFLYKTRVGIQKSWKALVHWAMWAAVTVLPLNFLLWTQRPGGWLLWMAVAMLVPPAVLPLLVSRPQRSTRTLLPGVVACALCWLSQIVLLWIYFPSG